MPARILVVDANPAMRALIAEVLADDGHEVKSVAHGADALMLLEQQSTFDLILGDLTIPAIEGAQLFWEIGARWPHLPSCLSASPTATTPGPSTTQHCARPRCRSS
jgi:CheY-like chemotaxis protein